MRFTTSAVFFAAAVSVGTAFTFAPSPLTKTLTKTTQLCSSVEVLVENPSEESEQEETVVANKEDYKGPITAEYINSRLEKQLAKMRLKDQKSKQLEKEVCFISLFFCHSISEFFPFRSIFILSISMCLTFLFL